jgi:hypothetical protein
MKAKMSGLLGKLKRFTTSIWHNVKEFFLNIVMNKRTVLHVAEPGMGEDYHEETTRKQRISAMLDNLKLSMRSWNELHWGVFGYWMWAVIYTIALAILFGIKMAVGVFVWFTVLFAVIVAVFKFINWMLTSPVSTTTNMGQGFYSDRS